MNTYSAISRILLTTCLCLTVSGANAQTPQAPPAPQPAPQTPYEPSVGQAGKDVVWYQPPTRWSRRCSTWLT